VECANPRKINPARGIARRGTSGKHWTGRCVLIPGGCHKAALNRAGHSRLPQRTLRDNALAGFSLSKSGELCPEARKTQEA